MKNSFVEILHFVQNDRIGQGFIVASLVSRAALLAQSGSLCSVSANAKPMRLLISPLQGIINALLNG